MKTFILEDFNSESFEKINIFLDIVETNEEEWQIYINSAWGSVWVLDSLLLRLHELLEKWIKIKLRWIFLYSCAFSLFYHYKWEKILEKWCDWWVHIQATKIYIANHNDNIKIRSSDIVELWRFNEEKEIYVYDFLDEKEKETFLSWRDIYLSESRLIKIFNN